MKSKRGNLKAPVLEKREDRSVSSWNVPASLIIEESQPDEIYFIQSYFPSAYL